MCILVYLCNRGPSLSWRGWVLKSKNVSRPSWSWRGGVLKSKNVSPRLHLKMRIMSNDDKWRFIIGVAQASPAPLLSTARQHLTAYVQHGSRWHLGSATSHQVRPSEAWWCAFAFIYVIEGLLEVEEGQSWSWRTSALDYIWKCECDKLWPQLTYANLKLSSYLTLCYWFLLCSWS